MPDDASTGMMLRDLSNQVSRLRVEMDVIFPEHVKIKAALEGDKSLNLVGLFSKMDLNDARITKLEDAEKTRQITLRVMMAMLSISSLAGISNVVNLLNTLFGRTP